MDPNFIQNPEAQQPIDEFSNTSGEDFIPPQRLAYDFTEALKPREQGFSSHYISMFAAAFAFALGLGHLLLGSPTESTAWQFFVMAFIAIAAAVAANLPVSPKELVEPIFAGLSSGAWFFSVFVVGIAFGSTVAAVMLGVLGLIAIAAFASPAFKGYWAVAVVGAATFLSAIGGLIDPVSEINLVLRGGIIGILLQEFGTVFGGGGIADALEGQVGPRAFILIPLITLGLAALFFSARNRYLSSIIAATLTFVIYAGSPFTTGLNILVLLLVVILALIFAWRAIEQLSTVFVWIACLTPALLVSAYLGSSTGPGLINLIFVSTSLAALANLNTIVGFVSSNINKSTDAAAPNPDFNQGQQFQGAPQQQVDPQQQFAQEQIAHHQNVREQYLQEQQQHIADPNYAQAHQQVDPATVQNQPQQFTDQDQTQHAQPMQDALGRPSHVTNGAEQQTTIPAQDQTYVAGNLPETEATEFVTQNDVDPAQTFQQEQAQPAETEQYAESPLPTRQRQGQVTEPEVDQTVETTIPDKTQTDQPVTASQPTIEEIQQSIAGNTEQTAPQQTAAEQAPQPAAAAQALPEHRTSIQMPAEPNWYPDPRSQYEYRWFDGTNWTQYVSVNGEQITDPNPI